LLIEPANLVHDMNIDMEVYKVRKAIVTIFIVATISLVFPQWLPEAQASDRSYQVQAGDTLWKISKKFDVPVAAIKKVNGKHSNDISVGERLAIPDSLTA